MHQCILHSFEELSPFCYYPFICSDCLFPIDAHFMQKGSSRQIKSSLRSRSCRVWCDLHHFSSTGRDNRHMDSHHTLPPIYVYTRILFHQYMCTPEYSSTNICTIVHSAPKCSSTNMNVPNQSTLPPKYAAKYI